MEPVVLSLGGSVLVKDDGDDEYIRKLADVLIAVSSKRRLYVVTGGGRVARYYIRTGRSLGASERYLDELGIDVTRLNARLLITALGKHACQSVPRDYDQAAELTGQCDIVVMGGVDPGITTDAVSSFLAERVGAKRLVNATSVDGAYTADPKRDPGAKRIPRMSHAELMSLVAATPSGAGPTAVFDPIGAEVISKARIVLSILDGRDLANLEKALLGEEFHGTLVE